MTDNNSSDNYMGVLLEEIRDQNKAVLEIVGDMKDYVAKIPALLEDVEELKQDVKIIKVAVKDMGKQLKNHERRIVRLESSKA